jgi:Protein chain release factor A
LNKLDRIMNGDLEEIIDALIVDDQTKKLEQIQSGEAKLF